MTSRRTLIVAIVIVGAVLLAYANTLRAPFIFDDVHGIVRNPSLSSFWTALHPPRGEALSGRPFANLTFAINRAISGDRVWSYHVVNVAIHAAAALALFGVLRRMLLRSVRRSAALPRAVDAALPPPARTDGERTHAVATPDRNPLRKTSADVAFVTAGAAALLWAVHPLQTEAVTFVIQRVESLMSLLYLVALYGFLRALDSRRPAGWLLVSAGACGLGMATKEVMVSAPLILLLYDRSFVAGSFGAALRLRRGYYTALAATWAILAGCVVQAGARVAAAGAISAPTPWQYLVTQAYAIPHYLRLALWPMGQVFDYGYATHSIGGGSAVGLVTLAAAFAAATWAVFRMRSLAGFAGLCFFAVLAPSSSVIPLTQQTIAEHRVYLALAVPLAIVVYLVCTRLRRLALPALGAVGLGMAALTFERNGLYGSPLALWRDTVAKAPENARAWAYFAHRLADARRWKDAAAAAERQLRVDPRYNVDAEAIIGRCLLELGRAEEALPHLTNAVRTAPNAFDLRTNLGMALAALGRLPAAVQEYETALRLNPDDPDAHGNLANALVRAGRPSEAWSHYASAARGRPQDAQPELNWAASLAEVGDVSEAEAHFRRALQLNPKSAAAHLGLGDLEARSGQPVAAVAEYEAAIQLDADLAAAEHNLAIVLMEMGKVRDALPHFRATTRLLPASAEAHVELASALAEAGDAVEARSEAEKALRLAPNFEPARQLISALGKPE